MRLSAAVKQAEENDLIQAILAKEGFLCSAYVLLQVDEEEIGEWQLGYYDPKNNKITPVTVGSKLDVGIPDAPLKEKVHEALSSDVRIPSNEALKIAKKEAQKHNLPVQRILFSLRKRKTFEWNTVFITKTMSMITVRIDADSGKVIHNGVESLMGEQGKGAAW